MASLDKIAKEKLANAYDYDKQKWVQGPEAEKIVSSDNARHQSRWSGMTPEQRIQDLYQGADQHARRHGLPKEQVRAEYLKNAQKTFPEQFKAENPFSQLDRDLPKGGRAMGVAEDLAAGPAEKAMMGAFKRKGAGKMLRNAAITGGLAIPATIAMEGLDAESASSPEELAAEKNLGGIARAERDAVDPASLPLKGNPEMIPYGAKLGGSREKQVLQRFQDEGKKHFGKDFTVIDEYANPPEKYNLNVSGEDVNDLDAQKAIGMHAVKRQNKKMSNPKGGTINMPANSKATKVYLEEDED